MVNMIDGLIMMLFGMSGIFIVMFVLYLVIKILARVTKNDEPSK